ncbi:hypothetical protein G9A89_012241 [Geosiphon pyriformis]|nr:hypothetical protein G9A89_012241 [Geosiphon pyriformis]
MVSSSRSLLVLEAKQSPSVELPVLGNWADQIETDLSPSLVSGASSDSAWETITSRQRFTGWVVSTLVLNATFKIKLAHVKAVFQSVHGFLGAKSVSKDNMKLFCVEFASQQSLEAAFLVELTSSVHLATLKIAKSLVVSESGSFPVTVVLRDISLGVLAANIKMILVYLFALVTFGSQTNLDLAVIRTGKLRKSCIWWETPGFQCCFRCQEVGHLAVDCKVALLPLFKTPKQISDLAALVKSIVEPVGSLVVLVSYLLDDNTVKTVQLEKDLFSIKYAYNNFANLLVGVSKDIACLKSKVDFGDIDYNDIQATKPSLLSEDTVEHVIALWRMLGAKIRSSVESTKLFLNCTR